jgi:hypothetical protein
MKPSEISRGKQPSRLPGDVLPMIRTLRCLLPVGCLALAFSVATSGDGKKYSIKTADNPIPMELTEPIQKLLNGPSVQLLDGTGEPICEIWFRKEIPTDAAPEQLKTGVTYREVKQTEIFGVIQFHKDWADYRKQKIKAGVYTMRLAYQPADGKHTLEHSEFQEFLLVTAAKADTRTALMEPKDLREISGESIGSGHPGVFMLWPNTKPGTEPSLAARPKNHWVLNTRANLMVDGKAINTPIGIGLNLVGHSPAE